MPLHRRGPHIHRERSDTFLQNSIPAFSCASLPSSQTNPSQADNQNKGVVVAALIEFENSIRRSLRILQTQQALDEFAPHAIGGKNQGVAPGHRKHGRLERGQLRADDTAAEEQPLLHGSFPSAGAHQHSLNITDTQPGHHAMQRINESKTQDDAARRPEFFMATLHERNDRFIGLMALQNGSYGLRGVGGSFSVTNPVNHGEQGSALATANQMTIA